MASELRLQNYRHVFVPDLLKGKVAFISGGGSGIGFTITEMLMRHGCDTVIASRDLNRVKSAAIVLENATGQKCLPLQLDVRKNDSVEAAVTKAINHYSRIDYLVNCAAGNFLAAADSLSANGFKTVLEIDTVGTFLLSKAVYNAYFKDHGGAIVNITATLHVRGAPLQVHAGTAKAGIEAMTNHLAVEWGPAGVRVNCVAPGMIEDTEGFRRLGGALVTDTIVKGIPLQRLGTRGDIANVVLYLLSDAASLVTAVTIVADGGDILTTASGNFAFMDLLMSKI